MSPRPRRDPAVASPRRECDGLNVVAVNIPNVVFADAGCDIIDPATCKRESVRRFVGTEPTCIQIKGRLQEIEINHADGGFLLHVSGGSSGQVQGPDEAILMNKASRQGSHPIGRPQI